jgi:hypothetical protein
MQLPTIRESAEHLAIAAHGHGLDQSAAMSILFAPIDAAERGGNR